MAKSRMRSLQNWIDNHGRRIDKIHPGDSNRALRDRRKFTPWPVVGAAVLILGIYKVIKAAPPPLDVPHGWAVISVAGWLFGVFSLWAAARRRRRQWEIVRAKIVDRELTLISSSGSPEWDWRLLCRFEMNGRTYDVTPEVSWIKRSSRSKRQLETIRRLETEKLEAWLIGEEELALYVNPGEPLDCEVVRGNLSDWILFGLGRYRTFMATHGLRRGRYKLSPRPG